MKKIFLNGKPLLRKCLVFVILLLILNVKHYCFIFMDRLKTTILTFTEDQREHALKVAYFQQNWYSLLTIHWVLPKCNLFVKCFIPIVSCINYYLYTHGWSFDLTFFFYDPVYADGRVCISILHAPGDDPMGYESSAERWSPVQSVEKILLSVVSMLAG